MASLTEEKSHSDMLDCGQPNLLVPPLAEELDERLNASELQTVLDMLAVMETAEELKILECLTLQQKRQVWDATPHELRVKLHHIKNSHHGSSAIAVTPTRDLQPKSVSPQTIDVKEFQSVKLEPQATAADAIDSDELDSTYPDLENVHLDDLDLTEHSQYERSPTASNIAIGDRVVLKAKPELSKAELMAIFEVTELQDDVVHCKADPLGGRRYPLDWLVVYSRSTSEV
jgi:hypothetical protein